MSILTDFEHVAVLRLAHTDGCSVFIPLSGRVFIYVDFRPLGTLNALMRFRETSEHLSEGSCLNRLLHLL